MLPRYNLGGRSEGNRTPTPIKETDFKSVVSAYFTTRPCFLYVSVVGAFQKYITQNSALTRYIKRFKFW